MYLMFVVKMRELRRGEELGGESNAADRFHASPLCKMEPTGSGEVKK